MTPARRSGFLFHPTSLPGSYGIGDLGEKAFRFVDYLAEANQTLWQILPLGPTGYGDSPYAPFSTFAGNELLIAPDILLEQGLLGRADIAKPPRFPAGKVDFGAVKAWKTPLMNRAARNFLETAKGDRRESFENFLEEEAFWLDDYSLFMDIKETFAREEPHFGAMWSNSWPKELALRESSALKKWKEERTPSIEARKALQFLFFEQWNLLKAYANRKGISIIGDIPIFVAHDSADVWSHRELFLLDEGGEPLSVAGVPPDYFSEDGQLWGNPLYDWNAHEAENFAWWIQRLEFALKMADFIRIDHFRGLESFWAVPFGSPNAREGRWMRAPGEKLLEALKRELGRDIPVLAEDLGFITEEVVALRDRFGLPGMRILQFAFDTRESGGKADAANHFLPHNYIPDCVVYTGTHDNDTLKGWLDKASRDDLHFLKKYLGTRSCDLVRALIREALKSTARFAIIPFQDILGLGSEGRMNTPSTLGGNWAWRAREDDFSPSHAREIADISMLYGRNLAKT